MSVEHDSVSFIGWYPLVETTSHKPFRLPMLALGTGAAVLIIAIVGKPLWYSYKEVQAPSLRVPVQRPLSQREAPEMKPKEEESVADEFTARKPQAPKDECGTV